MSGFFIRLAVLVIACLVTRSASAQSSSQSPTTLVGTWRGTSVCLVHPSACHDEVTVYRITHTKSADTLSMDARKIVSGEEQVMGVLTCHLTSPQTITCALPHGTWYFRARKDSLIGELRQPDNTKFRDVRAVRAR